MFNKYATSFILFRIHRIFIFMIVHNEIHFQFCFVCLSAQIHEYVLGRSVKLQILYYFPNFLCHSRNDKNVPFLLFVFLDAGRYKKMFIMQTIKVFTSMCAYQNCRHQPCFILCLCFIFCVHFQHIWSRKHTSPGRK